MKCFMPSKLYILNSNKLSLYKDKFYICTPILLRRPCLFSTVSEKQLRRVPVIPILFCGFLTIRSLLQTIKCPIYEMYVFI